MRAHEFIAEDHARPTARQKQSSRGLNTFWDKSRTDSDYTMNRVMMAAASTDGTFVPDIDNLSWAGNDPTKISITEICVAWNWKQQTKSVRLWHLKDMGDESP